MYLVAFINDFGDIYKGSDFRLTYLTDVYIQTFYIMFTVS